MEGIVGFLKGFLDRFLVGSVLGVSTLNPQVVSTFLRSENGQPSEF